MRVASIPSKSREWASKHLSIPFPNPKMLQKYSIKGAQCSQFVTRNGNTNAECQGVKRSRLVYPPFTTHPHRPGATSTLPVITQISLKLVYLATKSKRFRLFFPPPPPRVFHQKCRKGFGEFSRLYHDSIKSQGVSAGPVASAHRGPAVGRGGSRELS